MAIAITSAEDNAGSESRGREECTFLTTRFVEEHDENLSCQCRRRFLALFIGVLAR